MQLCVLRLLADTFGWALVQELLAKGEKNATVTLSILATIPIILLTLLYSLLFGKKKSAPVVSPTQYSPLIYKSC
jgi:hypothetical protein